MSERSELRRRREERMENGVKNLKGAKLFPKTSSNHGFGDASTLKRGQATFFKLCKFCKSDPTFFPLDNRTFLLYFFKRQYGKS